MTYTKVFTLNSKFHKKDFDFNEYEYDFGKDIQEAQKISIVSYDITNTAGTLNKLNRKITFVDNLSQEYIFTIGEIGKWINLEEYDVQVILTNGDTIKIYFDVDYQVMKFENITNSNNFDINMYDNYSLASTFGFDPINHTGSSSYTGKYYPCNQTSFINIACDNIRERDDAIQRKNDGVFSLFKVFTDSSYGVRMINDFTVFNNSNLIRTLKNNSFRKLNFVLYDEFGNRLKIKGNVLIQFRLHF